MSNNQLPLVSYEQAKRLKTAGFDWPCNSWYSEGTGTVHEDAGLMDHNWGSGLNAPTVALALKWMRDVRGVRYSIEPSNDGDDLWLADLYDADGFSATVGGNGAKYPSCEQVESILLDESLSLIEKKN